jgi:hypothetical protein
MSSFRSAIDGLGNYLIGAGAFVVLAFFSLLLLLQSPSDKLLWTGKTVVGSERNGLVYYYWQGVSYTIDVPGYGNKPRETVYLSPSDPAGGIINSNPRRILDGLFILGPLVLGGGVLGLGVWRRRSERRNDGDRGGFGTGLDPTVVDRLLEQIRQPPP